MTSSQKTCCLHRLTLSLRQVWKPLSAESQPLSGAFCHLFPQNLYLFLILNVHFHPFVTLLWGRRLFTLASRSACLGAHTAPSHSALSFCCVQPQASACSTSWEWGHCRGQGRPSSRMLCRTSEFSVVRRDKCKRFFSSTQRTANNWLSPSPEGVLYLKGSAQGGGPAFSPGHLQVLPGSPWRASDEDHMGDMTCSVLSLQPLFIRNLSA